MRGVAKPFRVISARNISQLKRKDACFEFKAYRKTCSWMDKGGNRSE